MSEICQAIYLSVSVSLSVCLSSHMTVNMVRFSTIVSRLVLFIVRVSVIYLLCVSMCAGQQGNLTERVSASLLSLLVIFAVFIGVLYLLLWQTYVLWLEAALIWIEMTFLVCELVFAFITLVTFARSVSTFSLSSLCDCCRPAQGCICGGGLGSSTPVHEVADPLVIPTKVFRGVD